MSWMRPALLTCLALLFVFTLFYEVGAATAADSKAHKKASGLQGGLRRIFMEERDATSFFKRRGRRAVKSQDELNVEQQQRLAADERKREFHDEQRNRFENYAEEEHNEQDERTQESTEQWREFHHDGLDPSYEYNRHVV
ncbi:putative cartilage matrix-associated protein [Clarias gariepinus]|uniref:unique cartilage matrix-associated protein n=1 Tax=Clarias gariepinus TaxID=13013 RepID=UPI00234D26B6|nr:unique cartilage matrix-associated protein [Clarias gariepinus]